MSQLELDPVTHSLVRRNGTFQRITGGPEIKQSNKVRLLLFRGEAQLATDKGIQYFGEILRKGIDEAAIVEIFRETILETKGIVRLESLDLNYLADLRRLKVDYVAFGSLAELAEDLKIEDSLELPV